MHIRILLNPKHETDRVTAFLNQLSCYGHGIDVVCDRLDLVDNDLPPSLENIQLPRHHLSFVNRVLYQEGGTETELFARPVNNDGFRRKAND